MSIRAYQPYTIVALLALTSACKTTQPPTASAPEAPASQTSSDTRPSAVTSPPASDTANESPDTLAELKADHPLQRVYKKARHGDAAAQFLLGGHYDYGTDVKQDDAKAVEWYTRAVALGNVDAMHALGMMHQYGEGTPKNSAQAINLFEQAAQKGNRLSQNTLAAIYAAGDGVSENIPKAYAWYRVLASDKHPGTDEAKSNVARMAKQLSPVQLELANQIYQHYQATLSKK